MNKKALLLGFLVTAPVFAYKETTHEELSGRAANDSVLSSSIFLNALGLDSLDQKFRNSKGEPQTIVQLFQFGSRHEDRIEPDERSRNHFFDPRYNRALTVPVSGTVGEKSPDWILQGQGQGNEEYSYRTARELFILALSAPAKADRERAWGLTFQTLGHVIHHVQDMAQPQHVRNDIHIDPTDLTGVKKGFAEVFKDPSHYEAYTSSSFSKWQSLLGQAGTPVVLPKSQDFWSSGNPLTGSGMADFTNRNFVSKDTNFTFSNNQLAPAEDYALPEPAGVKTWLLTDPELGISNADELCAKLKSHPQAHRYRVERCEIDLIESLVVDKYSGSTAVNPRASSFSVFDQYLKEVENRRGLVTLNSLNFDAAHPFLMPRAVSYSAGLIDHFFRGRMELEDAEAEGGLVQITIKNISADGNAFGPGEFSLYYDSYDGTRKPLPIVSGKVLGAGQYPPQGIHTLVVEPPEDLDLTATNPYVLVYKGVIGEEDAVSGLTFDAPGGHIGFIFTPSAPLSDGKGGSRLIFFKDGQWTLHPQTGFVAGAVDWKGWYENGKPTRVLSWSGNDRYFSSGGHYQPIFRDGKLFALAPYKVLGAALQKDPGGKEWIIAICEGESKDIVFKRPAKTSNSPAVYDAQTTPDGWQRISEFPNPPDLEPLRRAWLFNGDGTEAQTMRERKRSSTERRPLTRLKITTDGVSASMADLGNTKVIRRVDVNNSGCGHVVSEETIETVTGANVIAVDYIDNQEVLARVLVESSKSNTENGFVEGNPYFSATYMSNRQTKWTLQFGSINYELVNDTEISEGSQEVSPDGYSANTTWQTANERSTIISMDLRTDTLIARLGHNNYSSRSTDTQERWSGTTEYASYHMYQIEAANTISESTDRVDVTNNWNEDKRPSIFDSGENYCFTTACYCAGEGGHGPHESHTEYEILASPETVSPFGIPGGVYGVSTAFDKTDNFFVSLKYGDETTNTFRYFNFLSGGDPVAVTGIDPAKPQFYSIAPN